MKTFLLPLLLTSFFCHLVFADSVEPDSASDSSLNEDKMLEILGYMTVYRSGLKELGFDGSDADAELLLASLLLASLLLASLLLASLLLASLLLASLLLSLSSSPPHAAAIIAKESSTARSPTNFFFIYPPMSKVCHLL